MAFLLESKLKKEMGRKEKVLLGERGRGEESKGRGEGEGGGGEKL